MLLRRYLARRVLIVAKWLATVIHTRASTTETRLPCSRSLVNTQCSRLKRFPVQEANQPARRNGSKLRRGLGYVLQVETLLVRLARRGGHDRSRITPSGSTSFKVYLLWIDWARR